MSDFRYAESRQEGLPGGGAVQEDTDKMYRTRRAQGMGEAVIETMTHRDEEKKGENSRSWRP